MAIVSRTLFWVLVGGIAGSVLAMQAYCKPRPTPEQYMAILVDGIRADEQALLDHVQALRSRSPSPPAIDTLALAPRIHHVTVDANGNVYFILTDSWVTFNVGFVARNGGAEFLGDGCEPEIRHLQHLLDHWWYYESQ